MKILLYLSNLFLSPNFSDFSVKCAPSSRDFPYIQLPPALVYQWYQSNGSSKSDRYCSITANPG